MPVQQSTNFAAKLEKALGKDRVELELLERAEYVDPQFEAPANIGKENEFY